MFQSLVSFEHWTFIAQILNLFIQIYLFKKFLFEPVKKIIAKRQEEVDAVLVEAEDAKAKALAAQTDYEERMKEACNEAEVIRTEAAEAAKQKSAQLLESAQKEAASLRSKAEKDIEQERTRVLSQARDQISDMAVGIAEKLVRKEINSADNDALVDSFITEFEALK